MVLLPPLASVGGEEAVQTFPKGRGVHFGGAGRRAVGLALRRRVDPSRQQFATFVALARASAKLTTRVEPRPMYRSRRSI
jgi:hypothetical protein